MSTNHIYFCMLSYSPFEKKKLLDIFFVWLKLNKYFFELYITQAFFCPLSQNINTTRSGDSCLVGHPNVQYTTLIQDHCAGQIVRLPEHELLLQWLYFQIFREAHTNNLFVLSTLQPNIFSWITFHLVSSIRNYI